jgi:hypothetical protein
MFTNRVWLTVASIAAVLAAGCTPAVHIIKPDPKKPHEPVPEVVVSFEPKFSAYWGWNIKLDGMELKESEFAPAAAPGGTSSRPLKLEVPGEHNLAAYAVCGQFCVWGSEEVKFTPPHLVYNSTTNYSVNKSLKQFEHVFVYVGVQNYRSVPIQVTIVETSPTKRVRLASSPNAFESPGKPITVTIPADTTKAEFYITGDSQGKYTLGFSAPGVITGEGGGQVMQ